MRATVVYSPEDIRRLIARDVLTKFHVKLHDTDVRLQRSTLNGLDHIEAVVDLDQHVREKAR